VILADSERARWLERAEATSNARFVEARSRTSPERGACWMTVGGASAMFDGPSSPLTQPFSLVMIEEATVGQLDELEAFFVKRGAPVHHEVNPLARASTMPC
jgi:hypothetical protein